MNDEFNNNQNDINKGENSNVNSTGINEVKESNVSSEKIRKENNSSISVVIMFIVLLLLVFVFLVSNNNLFSSNNKQEQNNNIVDNNEKEENSDNINIDNNDKLYEDNNYTELEKMVLDEYYLKTTDIINEHILKYRYSAIVNNEVSYEEFHKAYTTKNIMNSLKPVSGCDVKSNNQDTEYDKNGVKYPMYCTEDTPFLDCVEEYAKELGLTVEEISKIDKSVWPELPGGGGGGYCNNVYDAKEIKEKYLDIYNEIFKTSFKIYLSNDLNGPTNGYIYDKNIDKIMNDGYGGSAGFDERVILESKEEGNLYKIKYVEGHFTPSEDGKWEENNIKEEISRNDENEVEEFIIRNKDKLPNYEIIFEKTNTVYKYKSIIKIENSSSNKINYEIKEEIDSSIGAKWKYLYVNDKKINDIKAYEELGSIDVNEFNDLLIVDEENPGPSRRLFVVDENGNSSEIDYKVSTYNSELSSRIDSYRIEGNYLYIKVNRFKDERLDWYCYLEDKSEVAEYEVKYEFANVNFYSIDILNEVTVDSKYKNKCNNG